jgi:hypothetical protein
MIIERQQGVIIKIMVIKREGKVATASQKATYKALLAIYVHFVSLLALELHILAIYTHLQALKAFTTTRMHLFSTF